ncbi:MAG: amylo-alpha-1,6-glucosidase [Bacteroidota bacterium]
MQDADTGGGQGNLILDNYLDLLRGQIDISKVPFSERGSRLVVYQSAGRSSLQVRLGERLTALDPHPEAYLSRPAFIPQLEFVDQHGDSLPFEASASPDIVLFQTRLGKFKLVFQDAQTLAIGLPSHVAAGIRFRVHLDHYRAIGPGGQREPIRSVICAANGEPISKPPLAEAGTGWTECILRAGADRSILLRIGESPAKPAEVPPFSELQTNAARRWQAWFDRAPRVGPEYAEKYAYAWWVMANNLISPAGCISYESMVPSKASYIGLWLWDSGLHAIAYRHVDAQLARDQIRTFLAMQQEDGMLPDAIFDDSAVFELDHPIQGKVTKPPILAWAAMKVHQSAPDLDFLREIYPKLVRWNRWWFEHNDPDGDGLAHYTHPYSSGLDDSPLWDHGLPVESPDLNTYLCLSMRALASMAGLLGLKSEAVTWKLGADMLVQRMLEDLWDEEAGLFRALHNELPIPVSTPFNLLPLWTGALPKRVADRTVANLTDPSKFWGGLMLPSVARDDPAYDPETMWRGPVWANLNYFFIEALVQVRRRKFARELRRATLDLIMSQASIYEYYSSASGAPPPGSVPAFGWTAAVFIDLAIQASKETAPP